ncbi:hypothetical protein K449DRAFT_438133 [Hypoxylon sp. EC38]|nr:hypothetical protein K449DRAFT_438133 [Hypoxylon sp. EC38]
MWGRSDNLYAFITLSLTQSAPTAVNGYGMRVNSLLATEWMATCWISICHAAVPGKRFIARFSPLQSQFQQLYYNEGIHDWTLNFNRVQFVGQQLEQALSQDELVSLGPQNSMETQLVTSKANPCIPYVYVLDPRQKIQIGALEARH